MTDLGCGLLGDCVPQSLDVVKRISGWTPAQKKEAYLHQRLFLVMHGQLIECIQTGCWECRVKSWRDADGDRRSVVLVVFGKCAEEWLNVLSDNLCAFCLAIIQLIAHREFCPEFRLRSGTGDQL